MNPWKVRQTETREVAQLIFWGRRSATNARFSHHLYDRLDNQPVGGELSEENGVSEQMQICQVQLYIAINV